MAGTKKGSLGWSTLLNNATGTTFWPATPWMTASDVGCAKINGEVRCLSGDMEIAGAYQTANVENSPDSANTLGSYNTANGNFFGAAFTDISANTQPKQLVRFGWMVRNTSTSSTTWARVAGTVEIQEMR